MTTEKFRAAFVNSDAISNDDYSYHDTWIRSELVVTSGDDFYLAELNKIACGATVYVYANRVGVVAAGTVLDECAVIVTDPSKMVAPEPMEYHRKVAWFADIARNPVPYKKVIELCGTPSRAVRSIVKGKDALREVVVAHAKKAATAGGRGR
jgi:putative restriction endonuclease